MGLRAALSMIAYRILDAEDRCTGRFASMLFLFSIALGTIFGSKPLVVAKVNGSIGRVADVAQLQTSVERDYEIPRDGRFALRLTRRQQRRS